MNRRNASDKDIEIEKAKWQAMSQKSLAIYSEIMALSFGVDAEIHTREYRERGGAESK